MVVLDRIEYYSVVYLSVLLHSKHSITEPSLGWDSHMLRAKYVKMEGDGLVHFIVNDVSVYIGRQREVGWGEFLD